MKKDRFFLNVLEGKAYYTTSEVAKICCVTRFTIRNWINQGRLNSLITLGGHRRILKKQFIAFMKNCNGVRGPAVPCSRKDRPRAERIRAPRGRSVLSAAEMGVERSAALFLTRNAKENLKKGNPCSGCNAKKTCDQKRS